VKTASAAKIAAPFKDYLEVSREQPVLITRNGKPVAVLVAVQNKAEAEQLALDRPRSLRSIFEEADQQIQSNSGIPHDQFWREVDRSRRPKRPARTIPANWLKKQLTDEAIEAKLKRRANLPGWQRLKRLAKPGDEFWSFRSPPPTWAQKLGAAGYALVRDGIPIASFTAMRS
jgi:prevent-host-death family protein